MKCVIFDMDGVIIDSEPIHVKLEKELLEESGGDYSKINHKDFMGTTDVHFWSTLKKQFNIKLSVEDLINKKRKRFLENLDQVPLVDNVLDFMKTLRNIGCKLGLASSNNEKAVEAVRNKFGLSEYIDVFINGESVTRGKPHPEIFLTTAKYLGLKPEECLVIEDTRNGVRAAKAAGMKCVGFKNKNSGEQDLSEADLIISSYKNLDIEDLKKMFK
ncbi:MAG: HAD family phosphatase [Halanaerobiaceae bacterium]|nr:HAD family phosphatase [Halanaerobiaceae bacterium]